MLSNTEIMERLNAALKAVTDISDFGDALLQPQKFDQFVRQMQHRATILPEARFIGMEAQQTDIDRTGFVGRILKSGSDAAGASRTLAEGDFASPVPATNKLIAKELQAITSLRDRALRRNIERGGFEDTLVDLFGEAAGRDFEEYALLGDSDVAFGTDDVISQTDGWVKKSGNKVYGSADEDFVATDVEDIFETLLEALPKQYLQNPSEWRYYVPWEQYNAYVDVLRARGTNLGDSSQTDGQTRPYKGIPVTYAPMLERAAAASAADDGAINGRVAMLQHPDNMVWGVFHEVTVEPEREAKHRRTDFVLTFEGDAHYEDENASVVALLDKATPV